MKNIQFLSTSIVVLSLTMLTVNGAMTVISPAPTVDGADLANTVVPTGSDLTWTDRPNYGQTFTTGADFQGRGIELTSFSFELGSTRTDVETMNFISRVVSVSGTNTVTIANENQSWTASAHSAGDWLTISFASPVTLAANTQYGVDLQHTSGGTWQSGITSFRRSGDTFTGGSTYTKADGDPSTISTSTNDRIFHVDLALIVPEPSTSLLLGLGGIALILRRRR